MKGWLAYKISDRVKLCDWSSGTYEVTDKMWDGYSFDDIEGTILSQAINTLLPVYGQLDGVSVLIVPVAFDGQIASVFVFMQEKPCI